MTYKIEYGNVKRELREQRIGSNWMLIDGNTGRNIRPFDNVAEAMTWIDEERRGV